MTSMTKTMVGLAVLAASIGFAVPSTAAPPIFSDDFNDDIGGLEDEFANTGQAWMNGPWGGAESETDIAYGQGGTAGTGYPGVGGPGYIDTWSDVGAVLSAGKYILAADIKAAVAGGERNVYLLDAVAAKNISFKWNGGNVGFEGVYAAAPAIPAGFDTGNIHIELTFDLDTETGSVKWHDIDDPADVTTSGNVDLGLFTNPLGVGNYAFARILPFRAGGGASGFDNISLTVPAVGIPGDVNNDGAVNIFDINLVSANWGTPGGPTGDANGDGNVDIFDVNVISSNWTTVPAPGGAAAVPEPGSAVLVGSVLLGIAGATAVRRRKVAARL